MPPADVLIVGSPLALADRELAEREPPLSKALTVAPGVELAVIRPEIAEKVMVAAGFRALNPRHRAGAIYAFVRYNPPDRDWDSDNEITRLLFLSHFVTATEAGFEYSARIETNETGQLTNIEPSMGVAPAYARAYCAPGIRRPWHTQAEAEVLRDLAVAYKRVHPTLGGTRVGLAVSTFADSPFVYHGRPRALLLVTVLEGLVSRMPQRASKQFATRVPALAADVGMPELDKAWAEETYSLRSTLAHGGSVLQSANEASRDTATAEFNRTLGQLDELLRRLLRKALLDETFRERIENIDSHIPVPRQGCPVCQATDASLVTVPCPSCQKAWR